MLRRDGKGWSELTGSLRNFLEPLTLPAGQPLYRAGDPAKGIFLLEKGRIRLDAPSRSADVVEAGALLGIAATVCGQPYYESAVALEDCRACFIARENFLGVLEQDFPSCLAVLELLSKEINGCYGELRKLAVPAVRARHRPSP